MRPTTKVVLKILLQKYIPAYGKMKTVLIDQGVQFQSDVWGKILRENGTQPVLTLSLIHILAVHDVKAARFKNA